MGTKPKEHQTITRIKKTPNKSHTYFTSHCLLLLLRPPHCGEEEGIYLLFSDEMEKTLTPPWLEAMLKAKFFTHCSKHREMPRNECNMFCADCFENSSSFCIYCRSQNHSNHHVIQIRRSSYHEVVRVSEVEGLIDVKGVHTYVINSANVFFLNERPQPRGVGAAAGKAAASPYFCEVCSRSLLNDFRFCSIGCKLARIKSNGDATFVVHERDRSSESSRVEGDNSRKSSNLGENRDGSSAANDAKPTSPQLRSRRRKGIPQRSPLFS
ncbi:PLATZ transcription factor family protein [Rhynchospora pubera]|uniref:PLATZ transcription factor family protein n=1 Tax=Rhynchospora pubera TaxID=906938 RepID=A0AAV8GUS2_9POAL|nr:PLATZ transcription factor family protein [Rhynchospora pubera]